MGHLLHCRCHIRPFHILNLDTAQHRDDATVDDGLVPALGTGLVALLGVILHELFAQFLDCRGGSSCRLGCAGIATPANLSEPFLGQRTGLLDGQFAVQTQGGLAALPGVRAVLEHEHLAPGWGNLAKEAGNQRVPEFDGQRLRLCRIDCGLGEFCFCHDDSLEDPVFRDHMGAMRAQAGSGLGKHRHMLNSPK